MACYRCYVVAWLHDVTCVQMVALLQQHAFVASFPDPDHAHDSIWLRSLEQTEEASVELGLFGRLVPNPTSHNKNHMKCLSKKQFNNTVFLVKLNSQHQDDWNERIVFVKWLWFVYDHFSGPNLWSYVEFRGSRKVWGFGCLTRRKKELFRVTKVGPGWVPFLGWEIKDDKHATAKVFSLIHIETGSFMMNM